MIRRIVIIIIGLSFNYAANAQVLTQRLQKGDLEKMGIKTVKRKRSDVIVDMPSVDTEKLIREDKEMEGEDVPYRFGYGFETSFSLDQGKWEDAEGGRLWYLTIRSRGARSLNFIFDDFYLTKGAYLYIVNNSEDVVYGPVTSDNIHHKDNFLTDIIRDSLVTVYLFEPLDHIGESKLVIKKVVHGYQEYVINDTYGDVGASESCNIPVEQGFPVFEKEANAVALVLLGDGTSLCSGSLVMTTDYSFKPYLLTAFHCINTDGVINNYTYDKSISLSEESNVNNWLIKFGFREQSNYAITFNGAYFRAGWYDSDFALVEMFENAKQFAQLTWLGWDRTGSTPSIGVGIHHPCGDYMKISVDNDASQSSLWIDNNFPSNVTYHWLEHWDSGITQGGSSGSPLLDQNKRVVGQVHGKIFENGHSQNTPPCQMNYTSYGKFNVSWTGNGNSNGRLCNWLDPNDTGQTTMNSFKSFLIDGASVLCGTKTYSIVNLPAGASVTWSLAGMSMSSVTLSANTPSTNQCTLTVNNASTFNAVVLNAQIIYTGTVIGMLSKMISKPWPFSGNYEEAAGYYNGSSTPAISQTTITDPSGIDVYIGGMVTVRSTYFLGKTITTTGPYGYYNRSGNKIDFSLCSQNEYQPFTIIVHEQGCDDEVRLVFLPCITLDGLSLGIIPVGSRSYEVSLSCNKAKTTEAETSIDKNYVLKGKAWTLEAYNAITARKATSVELKDPIYLLDTTGWEPGLYLLRAVVGKESITGKITVN